MECEIAVVFHLDGGDWMRDCESVCVQRDISRFECLRCSVLHIPDNRMA